MKNRIHSTTLRLLLITALLGLSACGSTHTEHGVTIEQNRSYNPLNYIPGL